MLAERGGRGVRRAAGPQCDSVKTAARGRLNELINRSRPVLDHLSSPLKRFVITIAENHHYLILLLLLSAKLRAFVLTLKLVVVLVVRL